MYSRCTRRFLFLVWKSTAITMLTKAHVLKVRSAPACPPKPWRRLGSRFLLVVTSQSGKLYDETWVFSFSLKYVRYFDQSHVACWLGFIGYMHVWVRGVARFNGAACHESSFCANDKPINFLVQTNPDTIT